MMHDDPSSVALCWYYFVIYKFNKNLNCATGTADAAAHVTHMPVAIMRDMDGRLFRFLFFYTPLKPLLS